ncbi:transcriptional adapter 1 [Anaeramoeba ignava]|uniref:Transcriptional adapter 1 n=1 Tax=Anaeramoeba ignava TaxID=1746090 RepID=A0A9Q0LWH9_ANAIG|nr:transcriptional adapter 1 [Anaeramoeba ignava]|eukprot:Anaeramoba_ignava/a611580_64.p1 GENE.a611580_64~~a611580_64.p1  ORF type:complete len:346 (-),score=77.60 a611580_64:65-1102(-)
MKTQRIQITKVREQIEKSLGSNFKDYWIHFQHFLKGDISMIEFLAKLRSFSTDKEEQKQIIHLHNKLGLAICSNINNSILPPPGIEISGIPSKRKKHDLPDNHNPFSPSNFLPKPREIAKQLISTSDHLEDQHEVEKYRMFHTRVIDTGRICKRMIFFAHQKGIQNLSENSVIIVVRYLHNFLAKIINLASLSSKAPVDTDLLHYAVESQSRNNSHNHLCLDSVSNPSEDSRTNDPNNPENTHFANPQLTYITFSKTHRDNPSYSTNDSKFSNYYSDSPNSKNNFLRNSDERAHGLSSNFWLFKQQHQHNLTLDDLVLAIDTLSPFFRVPVKIKEKYFNSISGNL